MSIDRLISILAKDGDEPKAKRFTGRGGRAPVQVCDGGQLNNIALLDFSQRPRLAFRGPAAQAHLQEAGLPCPEVPNQALEFGSGGRVLRLSQTEYWVLSAAEDKDPLMDLLCQRPSPKLGCYRLRPEDTHAWFVLTGAHIAETMAKLCGVDLRVPTFPLESIAQTSVARVNVVIVRHELQGVPCFSILCDSAAAEYLWACLLDSMQEFSAAALTGE